MNLTHSRGAACPRPTFFSTWAWALTTMARRFSVGRATAARRELVEATEVAARLATAAICVSFKTDYKATKAWLPCLQSTRAPCPPCYKACGLLVMKQKPTDFKRTFKLEATHATTAYTAERTRIADCR
jgi:hypothetical protein